MELVTKDLKNSKLYYDIFGITSRFLYDKIKDSAFKYETKRDIRSEYNLGIFNRGIIYTKVENLQNIW